MTRTDKKYLLFFGIAFLFLSYYFYSFLYTPLQVYCFGSQMDFQQLHDFLEQLHNYKPRQG